VTLRAVTDATATPLEYRLFEPYGELYAGAMSQTPYGFTGEWRDAATDLTYLRARYYAPSLGVFTGLDPFEGMAQRPMSLNGYSWVEGNVPNAVDPSGMVTQFGNFDYAYDLAIKLSSGSCGIRNQVAQFCDPSDPLCIFTNPGAAQPIDPNIWGRLGLGGFVIPPEVIPSEGEGIAGRGTRVPIPIPGTCLRGDCAEFLEALLRFLRDLASADLIRESLKIADFTIYADGGEIPPAGIRGDINIRPYSIRFAGRVIAQPIFFLDHGIKVTIGLAAPHVYIEFELGADDQVFDNYHILGDGNIVEYQSQLSGVVWRNCRKYRGLTLANLAHAFASLFPDGELLKQAIGKGRNPVDNHLNSTCPDMTSPLPI
jgi:RHS repeat-associated protein